MPDAIATYTANAPHMIDRFNAVSSRDLYAPVIDLFPPPGARIADIGAGPGRDAAWLASLGHTVLAVEPVAAFRDAAIANGAHPRVVWLDDRLPELAETQRRAPFDLVLLSAVWHHLDADARAVAMRSLSTLVAPGGLLVLSLRHGEVTPERGLYTIDPDETCADATREGLTLLRRAEAPSQQPMNTASGVTWTWLAFRR